MAGARLVGIVATLMILSGFMPWFNGPFGGKFVPFDYFQQLLDLIESQPDLVQQAPISTLLFLAAWLGAALLAITGLVLVWSPRLLAMFVGLAPFASIFMSMAELDRAARNSPFGELGLISELSKAIRNVDISSPDFVDRILRPLLDLFEPGAKLFFGAAIVILLLSILTPSHRSLKRETRRNRS